MADTLIGTNLHFAFDVLSNVPAEVTLNLEILLEESADANHLVVGEVTHLGSTLDIEVVAHLMCPGLPDPVDIREGDFQSLLSGKINTYDTSHAITPDAACAVDSNRSPRRDRDAG
jgi:hypothetical protein